jgi:hypothetical protein
MSLATFVRKDGSTFEEDVPRGCLSVTVPSRAVWSLDDLFDPGLMGRIRETVYRLEVTTDGKKTARRFVEESTSEVIEVRRRWPEP